MRQALAEGAATRPDPAVPPDFHALEQAAEWFAVLRSPAVSDAEVRRWQAWRDADASHRDAWARVETVSGAFERLPTHDKPGARRALDAAAERQASRRRAMKMLSLLCGTGVLAWGTARLAPWPEWGAAYRTATGERRQVQLADGGGVWLNTASAMDVDYSPALRRVRLHGGEILVHTAPDDTLPARAFVVDTAQGRLRALGTRFAVRQMDAATAVAVFEGAVEVRPAAPGAAPLVVRAGEQTRFTAIAGDPVAPADSARQAWIRGRLLAENMRLADFIAELARYRPGHLGCAPEVADLRLVGAYDTADTDRVLAALEATLPVRVRTTLPWWVVVGPR